MSRLLKVYQSLLQTSTKWKASRKNNLTTFHNFSSSQVNPFPFFTNVRSFSTKQEESCQNVKSNLSNSLTHVDQISNQPTMVDVSEKKESIREAHARCFVLLPDEVKNIFQDGEIQSAKGPVFATAIIAGTMAVKKTSDLIPFCHPLFIEKCKFHIRLEQNSANKVQIDCFVLTSGKTGVEMEALTGCNVAALTIYDMCKALSHNIVITDCHLVKKTGGKSDYKHKE